MSYWPAMSKSVELPVGSGAMNQRDENAAPQTKASDLSEHCNKPRRNKPGSLTKFQYWQSSKPGRHHQNKPCVCRCGTQKLAETEHATDDCPCNKPNKMERPQNFTTTVRRYTGDLDIMPPHEKFTTGIRTKTNLDINILNQILVI